MKSKKDSNIMLKDAFCAVSSELDVADKIINLILNATKDKDCNIQIDTKRMLEAVSALEKAVAIKVKLLDLNDKIKKDCIDADKDEKDHNFGVVLLPDVSE